MDDTTLLVAAGIWIVCGIGAYLITAQKGRSDAGSAAMMGVLLGPIGVVMAMMAKPESAWAGTRCGKCGKPLSPAWTTKCNHCGAAFAEYAPVSATVTGRICVHCGKTVAADRDRLCNHCGQPFATGTV